MPKWEESYRMGSRRIIICELVLALLVSTRSWALDVLLPSNSVTGLVDAIVAANLNPGADSIDLNGFTFTLTAVNNVTTGSNGLPSITDTAELVVKNGTIVRDASAANFRLFHVASTGRLSLDAVTLRGGRLSGVNNDSNAGGAVFVAAGGKLATVRQSTFDGNHAMRGSAIHLSGITTTDLITGSLFTSNSSEDIGSICVFGGGTITEISDSQFTSNTNADGGAIALRGANPNTSSLGLVDDCDFIGNVSDNREEGAAIRAEFHSSVGVIKSSRFTENVGGFGGAISLNNTGTIDQILDSTFEGNRVETPTLTNSPVGGAIFVLGSTPASGINLISGSSFIGNEAVTPPLGNPSTASGGAIHMVIPGSGAAFITTISNCTFSGNKAQAGGGLSVSTGASLTTLANTTFADNSASIAGGGLRINNATVTNLVSTIIADNTAPSGPDIVLTGTGAITTASSNLVGVDAGHTIADGVDGNIVGTTSVPIDPQMGPVQDNGGPTPTHALLAGSPAVDTGDNPLALTFDQRGEGFLRALGSQTDMGAFEYFTCGDSMLDAGEACDLGGQNGASGSCCAADCTFVAGDTVCRAATEVCDVSEVCTGSSAACPEDSFLSSDTVCRASIGQCDAVESCSGTSATCPSDTGIEPDCDCEDDETGNDHCSGSFADLDEATPN